MHATTQLENRSEIKIERVTLVRGGKQVKSKLKRGKERSKLRSLPRDLTLWCPTWFSCPDWAVNTVVPWSGDDQKVILQAFVGLEKAGYQPYLIRPGLQVI